MIPQQLFSSIFRVYLGFVTCVQVLEREKNMKRFQDVTVQLEQALGGISLEKLDISDEVREQVQL